MSSSDLPSELDLVIGERFRAPITGAGGQGYRWLATVTGDADAVDVQTVGIPPAGDPPGQGSFARELRIVGRAPGVAVIDLALTHAGGRVRERLRLTVRVR
ncbi:hypothetical protein LK09_17220 [Microbacterium mangrovi]|uniref:Proteinase inhibitor I42 chagasin domain-containing protein n=1 Tax=Microbacterium mangrovi TaxID=1348253 RepID=A0A0B2A2M3_9MICO|nr:hypothetical protein [Microbacterium mangrovi]KHK96074.1 hypothetical protein LK09_17220 [Microbacterium mangrovi]